ncbi:MAG TPA: fumarylacetoacetate hydrolase family protein [Xanthobacteraceae bacterium]|jgi:2-keto-4-pentenoate hydratase/2-oxohepta-3-ene-1,7-dioic acid hydratase in catechol pathway|nr:fumarylacetoacetate hydrolase family protein [Xanthobacteraceae bacterium]
MRLASYALRGRRSFGVVSGEGIVDLRPRLHKFHNLFEVFRSLALDDARAASDGVRPDVPLSEVELLPPLLAPEKILCIGINYANRTQDYNVTNNPKYPSMFFRAPTSLVGSGQDLIVPKVSEQLDYEGEIAIVIGRDCKHVSKERALNVIAGVTLCNEGTIRDWTRHGQFNVTQGKNFDASGSIGPWIVTGVDLSKPLHLLTRKNGEVTQEDSTTNMIFSFSDIIAYVTTFMTLRPGDVICTGTPVKKVKTDPPIWLKAGDVIEVECPEIGTLRNSVASET